MMLPILYVILFLTCFTQNILIDDVKNFRDKKKHLRDTVKDMFHHAFDSYMNFAYPADELKPLSCTGRYRSKNPKDGRGDMDESMGNFSLTLIESLSTLAIMKSYSRLEKAVNLVLSDVKYDNDILVSVFETNIRVVGGLLSGHVLVKNIPELVTKLNYKDGLLHLAENFTKRLLPAFNTPTSIPLSRINLKLGVNEQINRSTCTACAGTYLLEFGALSVLTGNISYFEAALKAMDALWHNRNLNTDLMGNVISTDNGFWKSTASGIGAGIDSYYEYLLKSYAMFDLKTSFYRFHMHYESIMKYLPQGEFLVDKSMHNPKHVERSFVDGLQAFWPTLQVLYGDLAGAIRFHSVLDAVVEKHDFIPEAYNSDLDPVWDFHRLRPELVESTYYLYKATYDPYYIDFGKRLVISLEKYCRTSCGYSALKSVKNKQKSDDMDSYVFSELFKYLYLLFVEDSELPVDIKKYVFTTEGHLLPIFGSSPLAKHEKVLSFYKSPTLGNLDDMLYYCRRERWNMSLSQFSDFVSSTREELRRQRQVEKEQGNQHLDQITVLLANMKDIDVRFMVKMRHEGVTLLMSHNQVTHVYIDSQTMKRKKSQPELSENQSIVSTDTTTEKTSSKYEMHSAMTKTFLNLIRSTVTRSNPSVATTSGSSSENSQSDVEVLSGMVIIESGQIRETFIAGRALFGRSLYDFPDQMLSGRLEAASLIDGCEPFNRPYSSNEDSNASVIIAVTRGNCLFIRKVLNAQKAGANGVLIVDNSLSNNVSVMDQAPFQMLGDGKLDKSVSIPSLLVFNRRSSLLDDVLNGTRLSGCCIVSFVS